ncbi:DEAD/DEAH box helicase [Aliiroseovarius sp. F20344]|uniref:DEAD/DEAH box helicase n=1 Tax=Aliiroseovarius sp. F20344 TaxID=2926414 RepID=UPI001FF26F21|nr:DEAD/DEAH box helicase [Aliiroseovarius sp. F20344]
MKEALRAAIEDRGYTTLTPVQQAVLKPEHTGCDLLVSAQTGSGKTLGFGIAISETILEDGEQFNGASAPLALVIAPTRELALQVKRELSWLYANAKAVVASCVGGMDMRDERRALARGAHIVVATPGRLRDHIMRGSIDLTSIRAVVLDEADEMLDLGFREDLEFILGEAPDERQTLLFSATVPKSIMSLAASYQKDAVRVVAKSENAQHADIEYRAMLVAEHDTENAVINTLRFHEAPNAIVFANTRAMVNRLTTRLSNRGFQVVALSGELSQSERTHALQAMRDGRARVCVATDVAARGIDLPNLDLVVHAELPSSHETLLHRSGRTGRAGRKGVSALVVTKRSRKKAERILGWAKLKAEWGNAPSAEAVKARDEDRMLADPDWDAQIEETERATIEKLQEKFSAEQIAAAYLRMYRMTRSAPEDLADVEARPERKEFGKSVWFSISVGRDAGAEPRRLLPMLCKAGGLSREDVGAIRVKFDQSYVQILEASAKKFLKNIGVDMTLEEGAVVTQLAEPPAFETSGGGRKGPAGPGKNRKPGGKPRQDKFERKGKSGSYEKRSGSGPKSGKPKPRYDTTDAGGSQADASPKRPKHDAGQDHKARKGGKPKGPLPPAGKPNSKKNKARALAAGGKAAPKRNKPKGPKRTKS